MFHFDVPRNSLVVKICDEDHVAKPKRFKSGSCGWYLGGKVMIDGRPVQVSLNLVIVGSKPPDELIDDLDSEQLPNMPEPSKNGSETNQGPKRGKTHKKAPEGE